MKLSEKALKIALCGFMACGKTTVAKLLASKMNIRFLDMDRYIEKNEQKKISEIFETQGEKAFRNLESKYAKEIAIMNDIVVATGGGAVINETVVSEFKNNGMLLVFIDVPFETIMKRLKTGRNIRPLVKSNTTEQLRQLYDERLHIYSAVSDIIVNGESSSDKVCNSIIKAIKKIIIWSDF